jgi:hypothetical protein
MPIEYVFWVDYFGGILSTFPSIGSLNCGYFGGNLGAFGSIGACNFG